MNGRYLGVKQEGKTGGSQLPRWAGCDSGLRNLSSGGFTDSCAQITVTGTVVSSWGMLLEILG